MEPRSEEEEGTAGALKALAKGWGHVSDGARQPQPVLTPALPVPGKRRPS